MSINTRELIRRLNLSELEDEREGSDFVLSESDCTDSDGELSTLPERSVHIQKLLFRLRTCRIIGIKMKLVNKKEIKILFILLCS